MSTQKPENISVFYDGHCPICVMEVGWYSKMDKASSIEWIDIGALAELQLPAGKDRETLLGKFHVRDANDQWHIGVDAFGRIWRNLPVLKNVAFVFSLPIFRQVAEIGYRLFLRWQRWHRANRRGMTVS